MIEVCDHDFFRYLQDHEEYAHNMTWWSLDKFLETVEVEGVDCIPSSFLKALGPAWGYTKGFQKRMYAMYTWNFKYFHRLF